MFLFALLLWIVDDLLPWFLPKRLHDLVSGLFHSTEPLVYLVKSLPVTSTLYEWMVQVSQGPKRMEELCAQNRLIHARLQEIQNSLLNVAEQSVDFQSELYEMQKRIIDIQEDHLIPLATEDVDDERFFNPIEERRLSMGEEKQQRRQSVGVEDNNSRRQSVKKSPAPLLDIRQQKLF